jgi:hypothetical protein
MGDSRRANCKHCRRHRDEAGELSWNGYCVTCFQEAITSNVRQMEARKGPNFDKWRRSMAACVGGVILDDGRSRT